MLLLARDEDGQAMTDQELRDELVTLLVAGHETTATGLAWAFELLLRTPRVLARAAAPRSRRATSATSTPSSRRRCALRPVVPGIGRVVRGEPFELGGYLIPPASRSTRRSPRSTGAPTAIPSRSAFRPERFLGDGRPRHLHVAAVRRRHAPLPRRQLRHLRDAGGDPAGARAERPRSPSAGGPRRACARASRSCRRRGVRVVQRSAPVPSARIPFESDGGRRAKPERTGATA